MPKIVIGKITKYKVPDEIEQIFKTGAYEKEFRKYIVKCITTEETKDKFKSILYKLFHAQHSPKWHWRGVALNDKFHIDKLLEKVWEEFITIAKDKGIESAIFIIFKRYEK